MIILGIDPHKSSHTSTAIDPVTHRTVASIRIRSTLADYRQLLKWAGQFEERRWAVENAEGLGRHLSSWLLARGEQVVDVPTTATARVRQLSRGGGRKTDQIDAAAAASVAALQGDGRPLQPESVADALALLDESRSNLAQSRVRLVNQLNALLRDLIAGGAPTDLTATKAAAQLRGVRPVGDAERVRKRVLRRTLTWPPERRAPAIHQWAAVACAGATLNRWMEYRLAMPGCRRPIRISRSSAKRCFVSGWTMSTSTSTTE